MAERPSVWGRMFARFQGEVPAATLEAYRRASLPVFELMEQVEARRQACAADGLNPWTIPPATRTEFLCAWNAFVLQTLGNDILNADYTRYPDTVGYVPPVTEDQLMSFFGEVEGWLDRARQAQANPDYRLDVEVPAALPAWSEVEPCPPSHLSGLIEAMRAVGEHAAAAMGFLPETAPEGPEQEARQKQINRIRQLYASAQGKARYAAELHGVDPPSDVQDRVEPYAHEAIERFYELGQLIADPTLVADAAPAEARSAGPGKKGKAPLLPSQPGFDKWVLTEPSVRHDLKRDGRVRRAIDRIWELDPDPAATLAMYTEIYEALERGHVDYATTRAGERVGHWFRCPWGPVYVAKRKLRLGGVALDAGQQFVLEVSASKRGKAFTRRILPGTFHSAEELVYDGA